MEIVGADRDRRTGVGRDAVLVEVQLVEPVGPVAEVAALPAPQDVAVHGDQVVVVAAEADLAVGGDRDVRGRSRPRGCCS